MVGGVNGSLDLVVAAGEQSFASTVCDAVEATHESVTADAIESVDGIIERGEEGDADGIIMDTRFEGGTDAIDDLADGVDLPVVLLAEPSKEDTITAAVEAGVTDVFPRATAEPQYELVTERIADERTAREDSTPARTESVEETDASERAYREVFENVSDGLVVHDPETAEILDVNERFCEMNGYSREELVGENIGIVTAPGEEYSYEAAHEMIETARKEGPQLFEWRNQRSSGETFPVEVHLAVVQLHGGERVLASVRDITERKRREREYEQIFNSVHDAIVIHDPETGEMIDVNDTFCELLGYDRETILELGTPGVSVKEEGFTQQRADEIIQEVMEEGEIEPFEWQVETRDGEQRLLEVRATKAEIGGETRHVSINRDITAQRRREREFEQIFNSVHGGITINDPETAEIIEVNDSFCELLGYSREEILDRGIEGISASDEEFTMERARRIVREVMETNESEEFEWAVETRSGETRWLEVRGTSATIGGEDRYISLTRDITERRRREREYEQIYNGVQDALQIMDPDTLETIDVNEAYLEMFGYESVEAVRELGVEGMSATDEGFTFEEGRKIHQRVAETGEPEIVEWRADTAAGERIWLEVKVTPAVVGGEDRNIVVLRDITERKRRERIVRDLHESTDDLQNAETAREVCEATVETAMEVLDLRMSACWLKEDETDTLGLVTEIHDGDGTSLAGGELGRFEPDDFEYGLYERGEIDVYDPGDRYGGTTLEDVVLIPFGSHGLFGVAKEGIESSENVTLDAARILARHTAAALDRVEREHELRESERRFRLIAEHIDEIIYLASADFSEVLYINPAYEEIYGRPIEELSETPTAFVEAAHPDDRGRYEADIERLMTDIEAGTPKDAYEGEYRIRRNGETRWVTVTRFPVENETGTIDRIVGRVQDVTERRRREREYEQIFHGVNDGIAIQDPETASVVDVNRTFVDRLGYDDAEEALDQGFEGLSATDAGYTREQAIELCQRVMETGESETVEWQIRTKTGDRRLIEATVSPAVIGGEERIISIQRDITERRQLERRVRTIAERVEEIIYLANADLTEVLYVNSAYSDIFGRPVEELDENPRAFLEAVHPEDRDGYEAALQAMLEDIEAGTPDDRYEFEYRIKRPDGEIRWVEQTGYPILSAMDTPHRFVGVTKDVTERHQRERTLETFHEATRELTSADSREAACNQAVRAAEDVLGFPLVSAYLYDDDTGRLEPSATTTRLEQLDVDLPAFGPGESLPWQVYVEGESATSSNAMSDIYGPGVSAPDIVVPLGSHGVMLVGAPTESFDAEDIELTQILAATLEAALNHVAGERELAEREAELRRHQERADQFEQLNTIIRDIEQATVERSSRTGIEEAVCERLVDVDLHDLVWIAEPSVSHDELVARTSAGGKENYLDALTAGLGDGTGGHPAVTAYRNEAPRVIENVATDISRGEWRKRALRHGIQSVVAVPIQYETTVHGILAVESSDPDAFDEATQDVLAELGRSIGYAITVTEREQALESEGTTELEFSVADEGLFMVRGATTGDCQVSLERTIRRTGGSFSMFYVIEDADPAELAGLADAAPSIESAQVVSTDDDADSGLIEVTAPTWFGSVFTEHGAVVRKATVDPDEDGTLLVEAPRGIDIRTLVEGFQERYPETELVAQRQRERTIRSLFELQDALRDELTDRQWEALETAYSAGYFAWPREVSGQGIADLLGVSQPTFNKHLRIAEQTAFRMLLDREYPESSNLGDE